MIIVGTVNILREMCGLMEVREITAVEVSMPVSMNGSTYLTTQDVCKAMGVSRTTLYVWRMEDRAPPSIKWGRSRLYKYSSLLKWWDARIEQASEGGRR